MLQRLSTLVHGDMVVGNMLCFDTKSPPEAKCAMLDLSWVGEGYAACDLVSFLARWTLPAAEILTRHYHEVLMKELGQRSEGFTYQVLWQQFELCMVDWVRNILVDNNGILKEWNMDFIMDVLQRLDGGQILKKSSYARNVEKRFPWI